MAFETIEVADEGEDAIRRSAATRENYVAAAAAAAELLRAPELAAAWTAPSALRDLSVGGLAAHLAGQILFIPMVLGDPVPDEAPVSILEYYSRVAWVTSGHDGADNLRIRQGSEREAADGPAAVAAQAQEAVDRLRETLPMEANRPVRLPSWGAWSLRLDDFLVSRMMELVVHIDDLAVSVGLPTPELPVPVTQTVIDLLARVAARRHGATAILRAFSRAERAPDTIAAF